MKKQDELRAQLARMKKGWTPEEGKLIVVGHGDCIDRAQELAEQVKTLYPDTEITSPPSGPSLAPTPARGCWPSFSGGRNGKADGTPRPCNFPLTGAESMIE